MADDSASASTFTTVAREITFSPVGVGSVDAIDDGFLALRELRIPVATRDTAFRLAIVRARFASAVTVFEDTLGTNFAVGLIEVTRADDFLTRSNPFTSVSEVEASILVLVVARLLHTFLGDLVVGRISPVAAIVLETLFFSGEVAELVETVLSTIALIRSQDTFSISETLGLFNITRSTGVEGGIVVDTLRNTGTRISPSAVVLFDTIKFVGVEAALNIANTRLNDGNPAHCVFLVDGTVLIIVLR